MPRITEQKKEETRERILSVSKELFISDGYYDTSTRQIAGEAGIAEGTIFNYFETKADIFLESIAGEYFRIPPDVDCPIRESSDALELILSYINCRISRVLELPKKVLVELTTALLGKATRKKDISGDLTLVDQALIVKLVEFITRLQEKNLLKDTSPRILGECIFGMVFMELFVYLNIPTRSAEDTLSGIREKITVMMAGHLAGGKGDT